MRLCLRLGEDRYPLPPLERPRYLRGAYIMNHKKLLLTLTLCLCALLCMAVTASASEVPVHSHPVCAGTECTDPAHASHSDVTFEKALTMNDDGVLCIGGTEAQKHNGENYDYILQGGTYYLDDNLTLNKGIQVQGNVTLCLNGHEIRSEGSYVIQTPWSGTVTFTLCDCKAGGKIAHTVNSSSNSAGVNLNNTSTSQQTFIMYNGCITQNKGSGVYLYSNTSFTMYGGSITGNTLTDAPTFGGGVYVHSGATFTMYGGSITENHANKSGGGIYSTSDNISIYGGSVTDNSVTKRGKAGGIYVSDSGTLTVGGNVNISGNWQGDSEESGSKNNVYLDYYNGAFATIVIKEALTGAPIGITTANAPTAGNPVTIVTGNSIEETYKDSFQADNAAYGVSYNSTDKVLQLHKHSGGTATCTAEAVCTTCGQRYGDRNLNNHALVHHEAQAPTCTAVGWEAYDTCSRCDYSTTKVEIPMAAHTYGAPTYVWAANNASCTATRTCTACQHVENETVNTQQTVTQNHSCTLNELSTFTATFTNTAFAQQIKENVKTADMADHTYSATEWKSDVDNHWHECSVCHTQIGKAAHEWQPATYTAPKTCETCGATTGTKLSTHYYYSPAKTEDTPASPKAGDPGVLFYAGLALASLTGLACTAKKRH